MWMRFQKLPSAVRRMIIINGLLGVIMILVFPVILIVAKDFRLAIPCLIFSTLLIVNSLRISYNCIVRNYVAVTGTCIGVERRGLKKHPKSFRITFSDKVLCVFIRFGYNLPEPGDKVTIYLGDTVPVYMEDGIYCIYEYYAMEIQRKI